MWLYILLAILIIAIFCVVVIYHDTHTFVVRSYEIKSHKVKGDHTFAFLSDLHGYSYGKDNEKLIKAINDIAPDAILCAGDMFTAHKVNGKVDYSVALSLLSSLAKSYPVYMGNGNHEHKTKEYTNEFGNTYDRYKSLLQKARVTVLENDSIDLPDGNIRITGLDLGLPFFQKVIKKEMADNQIQRYVGHSASMKYQILIAHNPQYFSNYADWGADLTVSGHVHGGIIRLPLLGGVISPSIALFPKYDGGKFEIGNKTMILSRGLGTHSIHVRMFNPGELDIIRISEA